MIAQKQTLKPMVLWHGVLSNGSSRGQPNYESGHLQLSQDKIHFKLGL